jgi:hypothetical protein
MLAPMAAAGARLPHPSADARAADLAATPAALVQAVRDGRLTAEIGV